MRAHIHRREYPPGYIHDVLLDSMKLMTRVHHLSIYPHILEFNNSRPMLMQVLVFLGRLNRDVVPPSEVAIYIL